MTHSKAKENLIPQAHVLTVDEQSKGGKASGVSRRQRKRVKDVADILLALPVEVGEVVDIENLQTINDDTNIDVITAISCEIIRQALDGNLNAIKLLFTLTGEYSTRYNIQACEVVDDESAREIDEYFARKYSQINVE